MDLVTGENRHSINSVSSLGGIKKYPSIGMTIHAETLLFQHFIGCQSEFKKTMQGGYECVRTTSK